MLGKKYPRIGSGKPGSSTCGFDFHSVDDNLFEMFAVLKIPQYKAPSTRIRIFLNPQLFLSGYENIRVHTLCDHSVFTSNSPVHTYSDSLRIH